VLSSFLKRVLGVAKNTRNRLIYQMAGCKTFVESIRLSLSLPVTPAFSSYIDALEFKYATIDPDFYATPVMQFTEWKNCMQTRRHVVTRYGAHGFHFAVCTNTKYHEADLSCSCKFCGKICAQYHFLKCLHNPLSLSEIAEAEFIMT